MRGSRTVLLSVLLIHITGCNVFFEKPGDDDLNLPPDPGEAGMATLVGIDVNTNGIRDDAEIAIAKRHPNKEKVRSALNQFSVSIQNAFESYESSDAQLVSEAAGGITKAVDCLYARTEAPQKELLFVENLMVNTDTRGEVYSEINAAFSGQFFGGDNDFEAACDE